MMTVADTSLSLPYVPSSETSRDAAESMLSSAQAVRLQVLQTISKTKDGLTCDEVEAMTGLRHQTASARICELRDQHLIKASGVKRKTRSGRNAMVYSAVA